MTQQNVHGIAEICFFLVRL